MGLHDRDYYWDDNESYNRSEGGTGISALFMIIAANVIIWLLNDDNSLPLNLWMELKPSDIFHPAQWYRLITCGFAHDSTSSGHILFNMLALFFLGGLVERRYGKKEFLAFYFASILISSLGWVVTGLVMGTDVPCIGASGAVSAVIILFAWNFPHEKLLFMMFIPMPAWLVGVIIIGIDIMGTQSEKSNIAHSVHLAGAAFACVYYLMNIRFTGWFSSSPQIYRDGNVADEPSYWGGRRGQYGRDEEDYYYADDDSYGYAPATKTYEQLEAERREAEMNEKVEDILRKISNFGLQSLTQSEMDLLREASRRKQNGR
ncbi:MAG: rhomboid family intramembrane serine protease [Planctomycetia bacterium]|nr:rhomboid family intramembrane serine protease [Planctomycetia bacterium]